MRWIDMPPVWLAGFLVAGWAAGRAGLGPSLGFPGAALGVLLVLAGIALIVAAALEFRRHETTIVPGETPSAMIVTGIYAWSRNPIYLGDALILAGACLIWGAGLALLLVPVFLWVIQRRFVLPEEARMADKFVAAWRAYAQQTNRWL